MLIEAPYSGDFLYLLSGELFSFLFRNHFYGDKRARVFSRGTGGPSLHFLPVQSPRLWVESDNKSTSGPTSQIITTSHKRWHTGTLAFKLTANIWRMTPNTSPLTFITFHNHHLLLSHLQTNWANNALLCGIIIQLIVDTGYVPL